MKNPKFLLDARFASAAAVACGVALVGAERHADAHIVWSGIININIPSTSDGVYLNVVTGQLGSSGSSVSGWDVNPYSGAGLEFFASAGGGFVSGLGTDASLVDNLAFNTLIGSGQAFSSGAAGIESSGSTRFHFSSSQNLVGFQFVNEATGSTHYGWMRLQLWNGPGLQPRAIVEYAYETEAGVGINAGLIPAPGAMALLGMAGLLGSRRRRA
jgi:hypothetical protein